MAYLERILSFPASVYIPFVTPLYRKSDPKQTSVNPAWYNSLWHMAMHADLAWNSTYETRMSTLTALTNLTNAAGNLTGPAGGTYINEANPFTQNWQADFWGENYARLKTIKDKYDPYQLLKCWCV
jgi:FAD/FMN-containing dehydrogenase